ncbi:MAG: hypothetical protein JWO38_413 [Gemmataceae bacterium]|nr:hypothetical protein [Gemmataceae bacterium]
MSRPPTVLPSPIPLDGIGSYKLDTALASADVITTTGSRDVIAVPANFTLSLSVGYVVKATTTATGIHAII